MLTYQQAVDIAAEDLLNYSDEEINRLAESLEIENSKNRIKKIAEKIILTNAPPDMFLSVKGDKCKTYLNRFDSKDIKEKSGKIYDSFKEFKDNVSTMTTEDLNKMFKMYDKIFFDNELNDYLNEKEYVLKFKTNGEPTFTTESICSSQSCAYVITFPLEKFKKKSAIVAGKFCKDQLECLQRTMEHEIVHLIIFLFCRDENISDQHGRLYMNMVSGLFGHKDYRHFIF